ncbi:hypothetical protein CVS40_9720 [Lucilia cuprina]|nr:hypothetical protein CVS40_9720 [Lucilia cuprina]
MKLINLKLRGMEVPNFASPLLLVDIDGNASTSVPTAAPIAPMAGAGPLPGMVTRHSPAYCRRLVWLLPPMADTPHAASGVARTTISRLQ